MIRRAIWNLQNQLHHYQQCFEEERRKLFDELRQQRAAAGLPPPSPLREFSSSIPTATILSGSLPMPNDVAKRERDMNRDRKTKTRMREYSDIVERDDYRESKRMRQSDVQRGEFNTFVFPF